jgi:hypothetical protein
MPLLFDHLLQALADLEGVAVGGGIEDEDAGHVETSVANVQDVPLDPSVRHGKWKEGIQLLPEKTEKPWSVPYYFRLLGMATKRDKYGKNIVRPVQFLFCFC